MKRINRLLFGFTFVLLFTFFCIGCGKASQKNTEAITTTDNTNNVDIGDNTDIDELATDTEPVTEAVAAPADIVTTEQALTEQEEIVEEVTVADNGFAIFKGVSIQLPEGYEYSADNSSIDAACFVNSNTESCLVLCVDDNNTAYDDSNLESVFDSQIKAIYGEFVTHEPKNYNNVNGMEWVLDDETEGTCGRAYAFIDGKMLIYIEFFGFGDQTADYEVVVNSIKY